MLLRVNLPKALRYDSLAPIFKQWVSPAYRVLVRLALRYPSRIFLNILLGFSGALFNGVSTALIVPVVIRILGQELPAEENAPIIQKLLDLFSGIPIAYQSFAMAGSILGLIILKDLAVYASNLANSALSRRLNIDLQQQELKLLLDVDIDYFTQTKPGDLMKRLLKDSATATNVIGIIVNITISIITIFVFLILLISISWQLTVATTLLLPFPPLAVQLLVVQAKHFSRSINKISREYSSRLIELFSGIRLVKSTATEEKEYELLQELMSEHERIEFRSKMLSLAVVPTSEVTSILALFALIFIGRLLFSEQLSSFSAVLLTYIVLLYRLLPIISQLNGQRESLARSIASVEVVHDLLRRDNKTFTQNGHLPFTQLQEGIGLENLSFAYPGNSDLVLKNINLFLPKGTTLALVGSSGAGKSTIADLLPRFYDPTQGQITIDGKNLKTFDIHSLRRAMGIVSQDTFLFNATIRQNIAYGCPHATEEEILEATQRANAYEFIRQLPDGLETAIGNRGILLSGGQRQRIAIARAILRNPEILILDEATSALDTVSERLVQEALDELSRDRTTLVIAHRLSTVQNAHQIAVMDKGRVVEVGTHDALIQKQGLYNRLFNMQFSKASA
jgi:subfamily B ATP-binding cassette protein MsbA